MQVDFESIQPVTAEHFKGGEGSVTTQAYVDANNRIMKATVHPHSSIGWHQHAGNSEIVYVLSGTGKVVVEGGEEPLAPGMCHYCAEGSSTPYRTPTMRTWSCSPWCLSTIRCNSFEAR